MHLIKEVINNIEVQYMDSSLESKHEDLKLGKKTNFVGNTQVKQIQYKWNMPLTHFPNKHLILQVQDISR